MKNLKSLRAILLDSETKIFEKILVIGIATSCICFLFDRLGFDNGPRRFNEAIGRLFSPIFKPAMTQDRLDSTSILWFIGIGIFVTLTLIGWNAWERNLRARAIKLLVILNSICWAFWALTMYKHFPKLDDNSSSNIHLTVIAIVVFILGLLFTFRIVNSKGHVHHFRVRYCQSMSWVGVVIFVWCFNYGYRYWYTPDATISLNSILFALLLISLSQLMYLQRSKIVRIGKEVLKTARPSR